jgi:hypothetical protein
MKEEIVMTLVQIQAQFRILHWQTTSYARHNAYGRIYDELDGNIDDFVETLMGKQGRFELPQEGADLKLFNLKTLEINSFIGTSLEFLLGLSEKLDARKDSDLLNIRDEIMGNINQLKYLLTLK